MPTIVSMLRGVNLAGHNRLDMKALRALCESLGLESPRTYIQSGNVIFRSRAQHLPRLACRIEDAIEKSAGFRPAVILRTAAELRDAIARNPFAGRSGIEPNKLVVAFFAAEPDREAAERVSAIKVGPEEARLDGRELYAYYPEGYGRSKLTLTLMEKRVGQPGTARNWNTVTKLAELAEAL